MSQQINLFNPIFLKQKKTFSAVNMLDALALLLVGVALTGTGASAHGWGHGWFGWHHHSPHYGWRYHAAAAPAQAGPFCWVDTDSTRGFGFYKVCPDGARPAARGHHRHHR